MDKKETGNRGEDLAVEYLVKQGYKILDRNWRAGHNEIDIIAEKGETVSFVEVKTRSKEPLDAPFYGVSRTKQKSIIRAANSYILRKNLDADINLDVIWIIIDGSELKIEHLINAFYPIR